MLHKFYFTCGQKHRHELDNGQIWDKDSVVEVEVESVDILDASQRAYDFITKAFGFYWSSYYHEIGYTPEYYKDGIVATYIIPSDYESIIE